ncbi:MAG: ribonuclease T2 family protein [Hyphomicrobiaceae bacterium]
MTGRRWLLAFALAFCIGSATQADAQREPGGRGQSQGKGTHQAGQFDYYLLALSWSPTYCASLQQPRRDDQQCAPRSGRRFAFVLHGLWPQYERGWPQDCSTADGGFVPRPVAQKMLDIMPSERLVFHQYRKHGTCSGLGIDGYFALARKLYEKIAIPKRYVDVADPRMFVSPSELVQDFIAANPDLKPETIAVVCDGPGNRLREVRICFDKAGTLRACSRSIDQRRLCSADRMYVPPVREGAPGAAPPPKPGDRRGPPDQRTL